MGCHKSSRPSTPSMHPPANKQPDSQQPLVALMWQLSATTVRTPIRPSELAIVGGNAASRVGSHGQSRPINVSAGIGAIKPLRGRAEAPVSHTHHNNQVACGPPDSEQQALVGSPGGTPSRKSLICASVMGVGEVRGNVACAGWEGQ